MTCWVGAQGQMTTNLGYKSEKHAPIMTSPKENPKPKTKKMF